MGRGEAQQKVIQADAESIDNQLAEIGRLEKAGEVRKAHPGAAPDAFSHREIFEGNLNAIHGAVAEHKHENQRWENKQIHLPVSHNLFCNGVLQLFHGVPPICYIVLGRAFCFASSIWSQSLY